MIERIAMLCSEWLVKYSNIEYDKVRIAHSLASLFTNVLIIAMSLVLSMFIGTIFETAIALCMLALVRKLTGGHHMSTLEGCVVFTTGFAISLPYSPDLPLVVHLVISIFFLLCAFIQLKSHVSIVTPWKYAITFSLFLLNIIWMSDMLTVILFIQILSLAPFSKWKGVKPMLKTFATFCSKVLEKSREPLEKWYFGKPSIKVSDQRSSNENSSIKADRKKRI